VLFGAVSLLLVIACANTATLLLVRASSRQREFAVRASIGAGRGRILQQLLTEGLVLAALSTAAGVALGVAAQRAFLAVAPSVLPAGMNPQLDGRVLAYAIALSALTGIVFGFASAVPSVGLRLQSHLVSATRGATSGGTRLREGLILLETAAAVVLLAGATILTASFARLMSVDPGFDPDHVVAVRLGKLPGDYDAARREQLVTRLLDRLRALPGVERVASAPSLPLERGRNFPVDTKENPELAIGAVELRFVSSDYFATLGIPLTGRDFSNDDVSGSEPVAIVNEAFARHFWKSGSPVGREIQIGHYNDHWLRPNMAHQTRVIGVARDVREIGLDRPARPTVLVPRAQSDGNSSVLLARIATPAIANRLATLVLAEEPRLSPTVEPLTAVVSRSVAGPRFRSLLIGSFAGAALLLATVGIYGVIAAIVEQRRREISIRISLGATSANVTVAVVRRCLIAVTAGAGVGLVAFWGVRRTLSAMVFDTSPGDPRLLALAVAVLALAAMVAAWVPARRATRVDPAISLRLE
jgi:predicted permease